MRRVLAVAVAEVALALVMVVAAFWCWHQGLQTADFPPYTKGIELQPLTYYSGPWIAGAVGCVMLAGLLAVDVVRRGCVPQVWAGSQAPPAEQVERLGQ